MATQEGDYYQQLRAKFKSWLQTDEGKNHKWQEYLLAAPDLFHLLCKLSIDKDNQVRIRLAAIDCPDEGQPYGQKARQFTADMVAGKVVKIWQTDIDTGTAALSALSSLAKRI